MKRLAVLLLLLPLLSSCSFVTLERQIYPICMSIDTDAQGKYRIGVQAPSASGGQNATYEIIAATGDTFDTALRTLSASTPYPLNFSQIRLCLLGYPMAAATELRPVLRRVLELPTMRPTCYVSIAMGSALDVMQYQQPDFGMRLSTHLNLLFTRMQEERLLPPSTLNMCVKELGDGRSDFLIGLCAVNRRLIPEEQKGKQSSGGSGGGGGGSGGEGGGGGSAPAAAMGEPWSDTLLPVDILSGLVPHTSTNPVEYAGAAAVADGRVSGVLTADQAQLCLRLQEEAKLKTAREGEQVQLQIHLPATGPLAQSAEDVSSLMETLQALNSDALGFGRICAMGFYTDKAWEQFDFRSLYDDAPVWVQ